MDRSSRLPPIAADDGYSQWKEVERRRPSRTCNDRGRGYCWWDESLPAPAAGRHLPNETVKEHENEKVKSVLWLLPDAKKGRSFFLLMIGSFQIKDTRNKYQLFCGVSLHSKSDLGVHIRITEQDGNGRPYNIIKNDRLLLKASRWKDNTILRLYIDVIGMNRNLLKSTKAILYNG